MADKPKPVVKLVITACTQVYTGKNSRGDEYTIYEVQAKRENQSPVDDKKLRSFEDLPLGELLEFTVTRYESEEHGLSFTLARKGGKVSTAKRVNELEQHVSSLRERLQKLEEWARGQRSPQGGGEDTIPPAQQAPAQQPPAQAQDSSRAADLDARFGAEPPW